MPSVNLSNFNRIIKRFEEIENGYSSIRQARNHDFYEHDDVTIWNNLEDYNYVYVEANSLINEIDNMFHSLSDLKVKGNYVDRRSRLVEIINLCIQNYKREKSFLNLDTFCTASERAILEKFVIERDFR